MKRSCWLAAALLAGVGLAARSAELESAPIPRLGSAAGPTRMPAPPGVPQGGPLVLPALPGMAIPLAGGAAITAETLLSLSPQAQAKLAVVLLRAAPSRVSAEAPAAERFIRSAAATVAASPRLNAKAGAVIEEVLAGFALKDLQTMPPARAADLSRRLAPGEPPLQAAAVSVPVPVPAREHEHEHEHALNDPAAGKKILAVNGATLVVEALGAIFTGSSALGAEAMHNAVDVGLMTALVVSSKLSRFGLDPKRTQAKISLLISGAILATVFETTREAVRHLLVPGAGPNPIAVVIALAGLANAAVSLALLRRGGRGDGFRALVAHFAADTVGSLGVIASGLLQLGLGWRWADPVMSFLIAALVVWIGVPLMLKSLKTLLGK